MKNPAQAIVVLILFAFGAATSFVSSLGAPPKHVPTDQEKKQQFNEKIGQWEPAIRRGKPEERQRAIDDLKSWVTTDATIADSVAPDVFWNLRASLWETARYADLAELVTLAIPAKPKDVNWQTELRALQAKCLLKLGKYDEAVSSIQEGNIFGRREMAHAATDGILPMLLEGKQYAEVLSLTGEALFAWADDATVLENCLRWRISALNAQQEYTQALVEAKRLFNISPMDHTGNAVSTLGQQLGFAHPEQADILAQFHKEQLDGAEMQLGVSTPPLRRSELVDAIKIDAQPFKRVAETIAGDGFPNQMRRGNLFLLAGEPDEAIVCFKYAYAMAPNAQKLRIATESIARCMRAQDGTVGRVNRWIVAYQK